MRIEPRAKPGASSLLCGHVSLLVLLLAVPAAVATKGVSLDAAADSKLEKRFREERERDRWQQPERVLQALELGPGHKVADVGAGRGYFTVRLSERVGPAGAVYAEEIDRESLEFLRERVRLQGLSNVEVVEGRPDDPRLPAGALDAVLVMNAYHEMEKYGPMMAGIFAGLRPGGVFVILETPPKKPRPSRKQETDDHVLSESYVRAEAAAAGFEFLRREDGFHDPDRGSYYMLVFRKLNAQP